MPQKHKDLNYKLDNIQRENSTDNLGVHISDTGTLQMQLQNGQQVHVRSMGVYVGEQEQTEVLGKLRWTDFKVGHVIGEGTQAKVRKVKHIPTGQTYALKILSLGKQVTKRTLQQELAQVLRSTSNPHVVSSSEAFYSDGALKILMEYMDLGTLQQIIKTVGPLPEPVISCISYQILDGLASIHASDVVHRDIKPSNLLVNSAGLVKISDFGVSTLLNVFAPYAVTQIGSTAYMSPERVRAVQYNYQSDIWSVGLTIAQCALGVFPFYTCAAKDDENPFESKINMFDLATMIAEGRANVDFDILIPKVCKFYPNRPLPNVSMDFKTFVAQCMQQEANKRPSCSQLMQQPFITDHIKEVDLKEWLRLNVRDKSKETPDSTHHSSSFPTSPEASS